MEAGTNYNRPMADVKRDDVPWRIQFATYSIGLFATTMFYMSAVVVPLWLVSLETSPFLIGVVLGARHFLPLFFSIHGGALIDRIGARRVLMFFGALGIVVPLLYPMFPYVWAVMLFQMVAGLGDSMGWLGAQVLIGKHMRGRALYTGRLSAAVRIGHLFAPPLIGWIWDAFGPWAAFSGLAVWGFGFVASAAMLPANHEADGTTAHDASAAARLTWRDLMPRMSEYAASFRLLAVPAIAVALMAGMLSHVGGSMHSTFYVVWLDGIGMSGTTIGILFAFSSLAAAAGAFLAGPASRTRKPYVVMFGCILTSVLALSATPLLGTAIVALAAGAALRGFTNGVNQPLVISTVLRSVGPEIQGKAVGIRGTANRVSSIGSPMIMGALAEVAGLEASFYLIGIAVIVLTGLLARHVARRPDLARIGADD